MGVKAYEFRGRAGLKRTNVKAFFKGQKRGLYLGLVLIPIPKRGKDPSIHSSLIIVIDEGMSLMAAYASPSTTGLREYQVVMNEPPYFQNPG